jgi:hypothetical protein
VPEASPVAGPVMVMATDCPAEQAPVLEASPVAGRVVAVVAACLAVRPAVLEASPAGRVVVTVLEPVLYLASMRLAARVPVTERRASMVAGRAARALGSQVLRVVAMETAPATAAAIPVRPVNQVSRAECRVPAAVPTMEPV